MSAQQPEQKPATDLKSEIVLVSTGRPTRRAVRRSRKEREFLPAALEIVETPPSPALRMTAFTLMALIATALAWSIFSRVDIIASAEGKVIPVGQVKQVQPLEHGIVRNVLVDEGDRVTVGQILIEIDPTEQKANLEQGRYDRMQALFDAESARVLLSGTLDNPFELPEDADPILAEAMQVQTRDALAKHFAAMASFESQIAEKDAAFKALDAQVNKNSETLVILTERNNSLASLAEQGLAQATNWQKSRQDMIDSRSELLVLHQRKAQTEAERQSLESKRREIVAAFRADASDRRLRALQKAAQLTQQLTKERLRDQQRYLRAPVSGTVLGLKANTVSGIVTAADNLMVIVPEDAPLEIEAHIENRDIGFVKEGMAVEIKLEAYTFTRYGTVPGTVRKIGRDAVSRSGGVAATVDPRVAAMSQGRGGNELMYPVRIAITRKTITVDGEERAVTAGMKAVAEVRTDKRRVIEFLLDKVLSTLLQAGRER